MIFAESHRFVVVFQAPQSLNDLDQGLLILDRELLNHFQTAQTRTDKSTSQALRGCPYAWDPYR
jgi:hypothetical protein